MKILSFGVTKHFADEVNWVLDLTIGIQLPPFDDDSCSDHIVYSRYVKLQVFMGFQGYQSGWGSQILPQVFKSLLGLLSPLELVIFLEELKERESPDAKSQDELAQGVHAPRQLLYIMEALGRLYFGDSRYLL
jgi:hypothetical protein